METAIKEHGILSSRAKVVTNGCIEKFMKTLLVKYLSEWLFTIKTECLITVLKSLEAITREEHLKEHETGKRIKQHLGKKESSKKKGLFAEYVVKHLQEISKQLKYAEKNVFLLGEERRYAAGAVPRAESGKRIWETRRKNGTDIVKPVQKVCGCCGIKFKESLNLFTALRALKNVKELANGRVLYGVEGSI